MTSSRGPSVDELYAAWMGRALELAVVGIGWERLAAVHYSRFRPHVALAASDEPTAAVPLLVDRIPADDGSAMAYVCRDFVCELPVTEPAQLAARL